MNMFSLQQNQSPTGLSMAQKYLKQNESNITNNVQYSSPQQQQYTQKVYSPAQPQSYLTQQNQQQNIYNGNQNVIYNTEQVSKNQTIPNNYSPQLVNQNYSSPTPTYGKKSGISLVQPNKTIENATPVKTIDLVKESPQISNQIKQQQYQNYNSNQIYTIKSNQTTQDSTSNISPQRQSQQQSNSNSNSRTKYDTSKLINYKSPGKISPSKNYIVPNTKIDLSEQKKRHSKNNPSQPVHQNLPNYSNITNNNQSPNNQTNLKCSLPLQSSYIFSKNTDTQNQEQKIQNTNQNTAQITTKRYIIDANGNRVEYHPQNYITSNEKRESENFKQNDFQEFRHEHKVPVFTTKQQSSQFQNYNLRQSSSYVPGSTFTQNNNDVEEKPKHAAHAHYNQEYRERKTQEPIKQKTYESNYQTTNNYEKKYVPTSLYNEKKHENTLQHEKKNEPTVQYEKKYEPIVQYEKKKEPTIQYEKKQEPTVKYEKKYEPTVQYEKKYEPTIQYEKKYEPTVQYEKKYEPTIQYEKKYEPTIQYEKKYEPTVQYEKKYEPTVKYEKKYEPSNNYQVTSYEKKYEPTIKYENRYEPANNYQVTSYDQKKEEPKKVIYERYQPNNIIKEETNKPVTYQQKNYQPIEQKEISFQKKQEPTEYQNGIKKQEYQPNNIQDNNYTNPIQKQEYQQVTLQKPQQNIQGSPIIKNLQESMEKMHQERNQGPVQRFKGRQKTKRVTKKIPRTPQYLQEGQTPSSCYRGQTPSSCADQTPYGARKPRRLNQSKFSSAFKPKTTNFEVILGNFGFNKTDILGQGAFGIVYEGQNIKTQEKVAIKCIDNSLFKSNQELEALKAEIEVMKNLESANVVQMYDVFEQNGHTYLILELCPDGDLEELLRIEGGRIDEQKAVQILFQILQGFKDLISHGYIHRDIKPANTLIKGNYYKLADFGLSTKCDLRDKMNEFVGSPLYMAPQLLEAKPYTIKSDIWSIGLMFYEMLFGKTPWPARDLESLKYNIKNMPLRFPYDVPIGTYTKKFIQGCLQLEEQDRLDWKELFDHPIFFHTGDASHQDVFDDRSKEIIREIQESVQIQHIDMHTLFDRYDSNHTGNINLESFYNLLHNIDPKVTHDEAEHIFNLMHNKNSTDLTRISYKEFKKIFTEYDFVDLDDHANNLLNDLREIIKHNKINIHHIFKEFDFHNKGDLKPAQFYQLIKRLAPGLCDDDIDILYESFDDDQDGTISYEEFYNHLSYGIQHLHNSYNPYTEKAKKIINEISEKIIKQNMSVKDVFNKFDDDNNGKLDLVEFQQFINDICPKRPLRDIQAVYNYLDEDNKGFITYPQLQSLMY